MKSWSQASWYHRGNALTCTKCSCISFYSKMELHDELNAVSNPYIHDNEKRIYKIVLTGGKLVLYITSGVNNVLRPTLALHTRNRLLIPCAHNSQRRLRLTSYLKITFLDENIKTQKYLQSKYFDKLHFYLSHALIKWIFRVLKVNF